MIVDIVYTDNMVLQRNTHNYITGQCLDNEDVSIYFQGTRYRSQSKNNTWEICLDHLKEGGPYQLLIESHECQIIWEHIYVGDVFLAAGQSNMEYRLKDSYLGDEYIHSQELNNVYFFQVPRVEYRENGQSYPRFEKPHWKEANSTTLGNISAVAYHFVKTLRQYTDIPIGIVECNKGGTSVSCWIPNKELETNIYLKELYIDQYFQDIKDQSDEDENRKIDEFKQSLQLYMQKVQSYKNNHPDHSMSQIKKAVGHTPWPGPKGKKDFGRPGGLYETMFSVIKTYSFASVLWYQGEEDVKYAEYYDILLTLLIHKWRSDLRNNHLPFFCVQLPNYNDEKYDKWPILREKQALVSEKVKDIHLIVSIDCGEEFNIHPIHKEVIGQRLGKSVLLHYYNYSIQGDAPTIISIEYIDSKLYIKYNQNLYYKGDNIQEFEIENHLVRKPIYPELKDGTLIFGIDQDCTQLLYAYKNYPITNLYGINEIPIAPFRITINKNV